MSRLRQVQQGALVAFAVFLPIGKAPAEAALVIGLLALAARTIRRERPLLPNSDVNRWLLAWFLVAMLSMVNSVDLRASLQGLQKLLKYAGLYVLVLDTVDTRARLQQVLAGWFAGLSILVVDGLWQQAFNRDLIYGRPPAYALNVIKRIDATFGHPASLGIYLVSVTPVVVACALQGPSRWRPRCLVLSILSAVVLVLALVRGGLLGFVIALPLLGLWLRHWFPPLLTVLAVALQVVITPPAVRTWTATAPSLVQQLTEPDRLMYWTVAMNMIKDHPIVGVGVNTFVRAYPRYEQAFGKFPQAGPYAHNQYLHLTAECGVLGLLVLLGVLWCAFSAMARRLSQRRAAPLEATIAAGLGAGLVAYLINGTLESSLFYSKAAPLFWFLLGLLMATDALGRRA